MDVSNYDEFITVADDFGSFRAQIHLWQADSWNQYSDALETNTEVFFEIHTILNQDMSIILGDMINTFDEYVVVKGTYQGDPNVLFFYY